MSILVKHFVAHQLVQSQEQLQLHCKPACYEPNAEIEILAEQVHQAFSQKPSKGVGSFQASQQDSEHEFEPLMQQLLSDEIEFIEFSQQASEQLKKALIDTGTLETGFILFSHYEFLATEYLLVALLNTREHVEIDQQLELSRRAHLDLAKMQLAVRIDLTQFKLQPEQNRYISFIKGRMGRKVSDFFMQFIGCEELVDIKQQNKQLIDTVDEYLASEQLDPQEKQENRQRVADYYKEKVDSGESIELAELAEALPKSEQSIDFKAFTEQQDAPLEQSFQADKAAIKTLSKFSGQGGGLSISFDRNMYGERITYSFESDTLMIKGVPPNLKDQLTKWHK